MNRSIEQREKDSVLDGSRCRIYQGIIGVGLIGSAFFLISSFSAGGIYARSHICYEGCQVIFWILYLITLFIPWFLAFIVCIDIYEFIKYSDNRTIRRVGGWFLKLLIAFCIFCIGTLCIVFLADKRVDNDNIYSDNGSGSYSGGYGSYGNGSSNNTYSGNGSGGYGSGGNGGSGGGYGGGVDEETPVSPDAPVIIETAPVIEPVVEPVPAVESAPAVPVNTDSEVIIADAKKANSIDEFFKYTKYLGIVNYCCVSSYCNILVNNNVVNTIYFYPTDSVNTMIYRIGHPNNSDNYIYRYINKTVEYTSSNWGGGKCVGRDCDSEVAYIINTIYNDKKFDRDYCLR